MKKFFFKHYKKIGLIIAILNLIAILNSTRVFLMILGFPVIAWLFFNACAPSIAIFLTGFFSGSRKIMAASIPFLFFFGGLGLLVFGWNNNTIIAQIGHILMVCAIAYTIIIITMEKLWKKAIAGLIIGIIMFAIILPFQQKYVKEHPEYIKMLGDPAFEEMIKKNKG
jgi:hypothetical protein